MGKSYSKDKRMELTENGIVNTNYMIQEDEYHLSKDVKIILYIMLVLMIANFVLKVFKMHRRSVKKNVRRNLAVSRASVASV